MINKETNNDCPLCTLSNSDKAKLDLSNKRFILPFHPSNEISVRPFI